MIKSDRLKRGPTEFDDVDFGMGDFDFGETDPKDRSPAKTIRKGIATAAKAHYSDEQTLRRLVGKALPAEYGEAFDTYTGTRDTIANAVNEFKNTAREPVNEFAKSIRNKIPQKMRRTLKLVDYLEENTRGYKAEKFNKQAEEDKAIAASLEQMFAAQDDVRQHEREQDEAKANIEKTAELVRFKTHTNLLNTIARSSDILAKHTIGITQAYQKKSLELQYRMVFGIKDTNEQLRMLIAQNRAQLDQIRHNTGLPESEKIRISERFVNNAKNQFVDKALGKFSAGGDNIFQAASNQFAKSLKEMTDYVVMGLQGATMASEMDMDLDDEDPAVRRRRQIAEGATKFGLGVFDDIAGGKIRKITRGNRKANRAIQKGASTLKNVMQNGDAELRDFAFGGEIDESTTMQVLRGLASMMVPARNNERRIAKEKGGENLKQPAELDNAYKRSITEVMPGYLARILQELQIARTGDTKIGLTYYDHDKAGFASKDDLIKKYNKRFSEGQRSGGAMDKFVSEVASGSDLSQEAQERLKRSLLKGQITGSSMTPQRMTEAGFWKGTGSKEEAEAVARAMQAFFDSKEAGKFSGTGKALRARNKFIDSMGEAKSGLKDPRAAIQNAFDQGHGSIMDEMGFTKANAIDADQSDIDLDKIIDLALSGGKVVKSDFFAKDGIKPMNPASILEKLKKITISRWKYKKTESDDQSPKVGPMAQDVNKEFGEEAAPGGKKIDLTSMNGIAMAGIQGLQDRIDKELGDTKGMGNLQKLVHIAERQYGVLSMIAESMERGGGFGGSGGGKSGGGFSMGGFGKAASEKANAFAEQAAGYADQAKDKVKGFWNSTMGENLGKFKDKLRGGWNRGKAIARLGKRVGSKVAEEAADKASKSRLFGARMFQDLKDGIPVIGELFVGNEKAPRITSEGLQAGAYFDAKGKVLSTLMAVADAVEGVFDENGKYILSPSELKKAYVKSNAKIFARVFADRVQRAMTAAGKGLGRLLNVTGQTALFAKRKLGMVGNFGKAILKEALIPPRDVYVKGEATPRLYAHVMRLGGYLNKSDGSVIDRPTKIKGEVVDATNETKISIEDLVKGLVDEDGNPFKTITQQIAEGMRKRAVSAVRTTAWIAKKSKKVLSGIGSAAKTFVTKGLSGFRNNGGPGGEATSQIQISEQSHSVLEQIRDILDSRLPQSSSGGPLATIAKAADAPNTNNNGPAAPGEPPATNRDYDGGTNLLSAAGKAVGAGASAIGSAFSRWRAKRKGLGALGGTGATGDTADVKEAVKDGQEKTTREIDELKKQNKSLFRRFMGGAKEKFNNAKTRYSGKAAMAGAAGAKGDTDGDGLRDNSWQDLKNKQRNINEPTKDLSDVQKPGSMGTENTIDMIINSLTSKGGMLAGLASGIADMFGGGGGKGSKGGKPGGKPGIFSRAASKIGTWGKAGVRTAAGVGARMGGAAGLGRGAMAVGGFALKRLAIPALAGVAALLGAPIVATALTVAGAVWGLKELYDLVKGDNTEPVKAKGSGNLRALRMAEYGVGMGDTGPIATLQWLEEYLFPFVKLDEGKASIDESKIDAHEIVTRFRIDVDNEQQLATFSRWLERRFKPNFLKHAAAAKTADLKKMADIDNLKPSNELAFFKAVTAVSEGHDELSNPFGSGNDLSVNGAAIRDMKEVLGKMLEEKASKASKTEKLALETSKGDMKRKEVDAVLKSAQDQSKGGAAAGKAGMKDYVDMKSQHNQLNAYKDDVSKDVSALGGKGITYSTNNIEPLPSKSVDALASIRFRLYGIMDVQPNKVASLNSLEAHVQKQIDLSSNGVATFTGDPSKVLTIVNGLFGVDKDNTRAVDNWVTWFQSRFLPVFTTFYAQACFHTQTKDLAAANAALTPTQSEAVANAMMAIASQVMKVSASPWPGYTLSETTVSIKPFVELLKERAEKQTIQEEKVKSSPASTTPTQTPQMLRAVYRPDTPQMAGAKPAYQANVLPDMESDAKANAGSSGGPAKTEKTSAPPSAGSLKVAGGDLMNGSGAEAFLKYHSGATLDGANPEAVKLFRGMVEEYGTITGKKIQLNAGMRSFADQQREYMNNPENAARPGTSLHEYGLAFDINSIDANALDKLGLMRKYGFTRPVGGEPWHIEPAGIQDNVNKYKKDGMAATMAVSHSPGKGGGGVGRAKGLYAHGRRNTDHALALFNAGGETIKSDREGDASRSAATPSMTGKGGYAGGAAQIGAEVTASGSAGSIGGSGGGSLPDFEGSPKLKGSPAGQAQTALNNYEGKGGGYQDLKGGGSSVADMKKLVADAAAQVGVDPNLAQTTVAVESSFKSGAAAGTSSAKGLYQFTKGTWNDMVKKHGASYGIPADASPNDPKANAIMGALYLKQNLQTAQKAGMPANALSAYLLHFLGPGGGRRFMGLADNVTPAHAMPEAAAANKPIFFDGGRPRTKQEIMTLLQNKLTKAASAFGIGSPDVGNVTQVAKATTPAANDSAGSVSTPSPSTSVASESGAPTMQNALYRPSQEETTPKPRQVSSGSPSFMPMAVQPAMQRDARDTEVGARSTHEKNLIDGIGNTNKILIESRDIQQRILDLMIAKQGEQTEAASTAGAATPPAPSSTGSPQPDRRPRKVSEPIVDTRRVA